MLPGAGPPQGVQPQRPMSVELPEFTDSPNERQSLDVLPTDGNAEKASGF